MIDTAELDDRIAKCEKILASDANSQIFAALAEAYRKKGDLNKAQEVCLKGLKNHPNYSSARVVMAKIYMAKNDYERAWDELRISVESSGRTRAIDLLESEILIKTGRTNEAKAILQRLYLSDPEDELIKNLIKVAGEEESASYMAELDVTRLAPNNAGGGRIDLQRAINIIRVTPRVTGVVAVDEQGIIIDGRLDGNISNEDIAALSRGVFDICETGSERISLGTAREMLIETESTKLWLINTDRFLLVILTREDVSMGSLRLKLEDLLSRVDYKGRFPVNGGVR